MIPRDYQRAAVAAAREKTASEGNTLLALATGGGKTVIAGFYIGEEAADDPASRFLVVQHTDELIEQNLRTIDHITALPSSVVKAERDDWSGRVRQRADARPRKPAGAHDPGLAPGHRRVPPRCRRQLSGGDRPHPVAASGPQAPGPERDAGTGRRPQPAADLLQRRLPPADRRADRAGHPGAAPHLHHRSHRRRRTRRHRCGGRRLRHASGREGAQSLHPQRGRGRALVRACSRSSHHRVLRHRRACRGGRRGVPRCRHHRRDHHRRDAGEGEGRTRRPVRPRRGAAAHQLHGVDRGLDSQPVGCIVILRPMLHRSTFIQAIGRGLRKVDPERFPGIVKTDCVVLDFTGAAQRHGSIEMDVHLDDENAERGAVPYKMCPECRAQLPLGTSPCPFCGHVWQRNIGEKRLLEQFDLTEIDLLNRSPFRWCDLFGDDHALIASGFDAWAGVFFDGAHWHAVGKPQQGRLCHLAIGTRTQVLSAADDFLRDIESTDAANKSRRWLKDPASDKQRQLLTRAGYSTASLDFGLSKYTANCHLNFLWHRAAIRSAVFAAGPRRAA